ncbi:imelysin family protein [uncultured Flavobacterium sp.]|uniref:imelysin family protein n=1 Tax=uncultured Flavobacterium sp. TaxID=165435 RepID=UPI000B033B21
MKKLFLMLCATALVVACSGSDDSGSGNTDSFDRGAMLTNLADNIIIPAYQDLDTKLGLLVTAKDAFVATPNQANLDGFRTSWLNAYKTWQHVEMLNIGKAEETLYHFQMNVYPASTVDIEANIAAGGYDLTHANNYDAVGFPALDYMLYGVADTDAAIVEKYSTNPDAAKYTTYLTDLIDRMNSLTGAVVTDWEGAYRATFIAGTANTASSAANKLINDYIFYFEKGLRANKVGIPAGNFSTTPLPEKVEAFYNQEVSRELALEALKAVRNVFEGKGYLTGTAGSSFKTYLDFLNKSELATSINNGFANAQLEMEGLNNNFYTQVTTDNTKMTETYDALQTVVVLLKVDMLQAFNVSVDYVDADGD